MSKKSRPGILCEKCGSYYDRQDGGCDCEKNPDARAQIVERNQAIMKKAYSNPVPRAYLEFDYK